MSNGHLHAPPASHFTLATFVLGVEQDLVSLRRRTRAAAHDLGLTERRQRGLAAAAYEAAGLLYRAGLEAGANLQLVDGPTLQVTVHAAGAPGALDTLRATLFPAIDRLRVLVDRLTIDDGTGSISMSIGALVPSSQRLPAAEAVAPSGKSSAVAPPSGERADLLRAVRDLHGELDETNRGVVALYAELEDQADRLRQAKEDLRGRAEDLAAANRAKEEFLATLSHELRTPLNAMLGWTRLLRMGKLDAATHARALETIERNAHVQAQLIADILDVSRIVTGKLRVELRPVDLAPIVDASVDAVQPTADAKGIALTRRVAAVGSVLGDPDRLQQVLWNLLSNAVKFTPSGGRVTIAVERSGSHALVSVTDSGEGIAPELLPCIFDRFTQGDGSVARHHGGLGLGLSIVRHIVELHGGHVQAASEGSGRGARLSVFLPLHAGQADAAGKPAVV